MARGPRVPRGLVAGTSLAAAILLGGCGLLASAPRPFPWHYNFGLAVHGHTYRVTHETVPRIGRKLTTVAYHGMASGWYAVYSVPGVPVSQEVAVLARQGYLKAVRAASP